MLVLESFAHVLNKWSLNNYSEAYLGPYQTSMIELGGKYATAISMLIVHCSLEWHWMEPPISQFSVRKKNNSLQVSFQLYFYRDSY